MFGNLKELPAPVGPYQAGITHMDFRDLNRQQVFAFEEKNACREIPVTIFYPADQVRHSQTAPYAFKEAIEEAKKMTFGLWSRNIFKIKTRLYENVPLAGKEESFPVVFFNHGYFAYEMQNTVLCSDLASLGYIVISVGHPYESSSVRYCDGRVVRARQATVTGFNISLNKKYLQQLIKIFQDQKEDYSDQKAMQATEILYRRNSRELSQSVKLWSEDTRFIADQLAAVNQGKIESIFKNRLQLCRGLGITGFSIGGAVAAQTCLTDKRFKCGINIDGGSWGDYIGQDLKTPFLVIGGKMMWNTARTTYIYNSEDSYVVFVGKTGHWGYTDILLISRQAIIMIGLREKYQLRQILTDYHAAFFDKYLLGQSSIQLNRQKFNDIQYREKLKQSG